MADLAHFFFFLFENNELSFIFVLIFKINNCKIFEGCLSREFIFHKFSDSPPSLVFGTVISL